MLIIQFVIVLSMLSCCMLINMLVMLFTVLSNCCWNYRLFLFIDSVLQFDSGNHNVYYLVYISTGSVIYNLANTITDIFSAV